MNAILHARILGAIYLVFALVTLGAGAFFVIVGLAYGRENAIFVLFPGAFLLAGGAACLLISIGLRRNRKWAATSAKALGFLFILAAFSEVRYWISGLIEALAPGMNETAVAAAFAAAAILLGAYSAFVAWLQQHSTPLNPAQTD